MDRPPPDPKKLLDEWMEWERGEATPGRIMANLKTAGLRDLLEELAALAAAAATSAAATPSAAVTSSAAAASAGAEPGGAGATAEAESASDEVPAWTPTV